MALAAAMPDWSKQEISLTIPAGRTCRLSGEATRSLPRLTFAARSSILELPLPEGMDSIPECYLTGMGAPGTLVVEGSFTQTTPITIGAEGAPGTLELEYGGDVSLAELTLAGPAATLRLETAGTATVGTLRLDSAAGVVDVWRGRLRVTGALEGMAAGTNSQFLVDSPLTLDAALPPGDETSGTLALTITSAGHLTLGGDLALTPASRRTLTLNGGSIRALDDGPIAIQTDRGARILEEGASIGWNIALDCATELGGGTWRPTMARPSRSCATSPARWRAPDRWGPSWARWATSPSASPGRWTRG